MSLRATALQLVFTNIWDSGLSVKPLRGRPDLGILLSLRGCGKSIRADDTPAPAVLTGRTKNKHWETINKHREMTALSQSLPVFVHMIYSHTGLSRSGSMLWFIEFSCFLYLHPLSP